MKAMQMYYALCMYNVLCKLNTLYEKEKKRNSVISIGLQHSRINCWVHVQWITNSTSSALDFHPSSLYT